MVRAGSEEQVSASVLAGRSGRPHGSLIDLRRLTKSYTTAAGAIVVLRDIELQVEQSEFVAIVGKSGSGKSTLLNLIAGIDRPTSGQVWVTSTAVHALDENRTAIWRGRSVGVIFQFFQLLPGLTAVENVMLPMDFGGVYPARARRGRALALLAQMEMAGYADALPAALSGGQQQRVAIARALANDPPLLLADEPTGNLDSAAAAAVFRLFRQLVARGKTVLMVTHDHDLARQAPRTITLADGTIVDERRTGAAAARAVAHG